MMRRRQCGARGPRPEGNNAPAGCEGEEALVLDLDRKGAREAGRAGCVGAAPQHWVRGATYGAHHHHHTPAPPPPTGSSPSLAPSSYPTSFVPFHDPRCRCSDKNLGLEPLARRPHGGEVNLGNRGIGGLGTARGSLEFGRRWRRRGVEGLGGQGWTSRGVERNNTCFREDAEVGRDVRILQIKK